MQFNANSFKNDPAAPGQMDFALSVAELNQGLGFGLSDSFLNTAVVTKVTSNNCNFHQDGVTVCGSLNLECIELDTRFDSLFKFISRSLFKTIQRERRMSVAL